MKKIVSLVILACLLLSTTCIAESEEESQPILFRDIEWGANMPTVYAAMSEVTFSKPMNSSAGNVEYYILEDGEVKFLDDVCANVYSYSTKGMSVAGYELSTINLKFAYTPDETGILPKDEEHTAFTLGEYIIDPKDLKFVMSDLLQKLSSVYGEPFEHRTSDIVISREIYAWSGADGTLVSLIGEEYSSGTTKVHIRYSFRGADDYYQQAIDALILEESKNTDTSDVSGL